MKNQSYAACITSLCLAWSSGAAIVSINVTDGGSGFGNATPTETAGAELAGNWNTLSRTGAALNNTTASDLFDSTGAGSGVAVAQSSSQGGTFNSGTSGFSGTVGNKVMENYADTAGSYTYTFSNMNAGVGAVYDVLIYSARSFSNTGVSQFDVNGQTLYLTNESKAGDYAESGFATQALAESNLNDGNYVRFRNVSLDTLVIQVTALTDSTNGGSRAAVNAIQLVQVPEPGSLAQIGAGGLLIARLRRD